uniref:Uncharacterized protein n=1 Tax=Kalanchoe fedtschenkoi TaxID=63787 RepID=A0A7N0SW54_KALFE
MRRFVQSLDLSDEDASYTIGQLMGHLQVTLDWQEYEKVGGLLQRREERIRGEAAAEAEKQVSTVMEFKEKMARLQRDLAGVEGRHAELVKLNVTAEERLAEVEKEKRGVVEENGRLREEDRELRRAEEAGRVRVLELEIQAEVEEILRERAEEEREAAENRCKELVLRISKLEKQNILLMSRSSCAAEASRCLSSAQIRACGQNGNVVEGSDSRTPVANGSGNVIHISDSEDDMCDPPSIKRKRLTLISKENRNLAKSAPPIGKDTSQHQPSQQDRETTPPSRVVSIHSGPS